MAGLEDLIAAARSGDLAQVRAGLDADPTLVHRRTMFGSGAVHAAHAAGQASVVELLMEQAGGPDPFLAAELGAAADLAAMLDRDPDLVGAFSRGGASLLVSACYWGRTPAARLLLDRGADPDAPTRDGFLDIRPLGAAAATPDVPNPSDDEAVVLDLCALLLDRGADVNGRRRDGLTVLHTAAWRGHLQVIGLLLSRGADRTIRGASGAHANQTAADMARSQGQEAAASLLEG
jgi:ankyrin repeat protein